MLKESSIHRISFDDDGSECYAELEGDAIEIGIDQMSVSFDVNHIDQLIEILQRLYGKRFGLTPAVSTPAATDGGLRDILWAARMNRTGYFVRRKDWGKGVECRGGMRFYEDGHPVSVYKLNENDIVATDWEASGYEIK